MRLIKLILCTLIFLKTIHGKTSQNALHDKQSVRLLEEKISEIEQLPIYQQLLAPQGEQQDYSLPEWIIEQNQKTARQQVQYEKIVQQEFSILLQHKGQFVFKWDPAKNKELCLQVYIKFINNAGQLDFPSGEKSQFLEVFSKRRERDTYYYVNKVYFHKRILINFDTDYRIIKFLNLYPNKIIVDIKLQWAGNVIKDGVKDSELEQTKNKMVNLVGEVKHIIKFDQKLFQLEKSISIQRAEHHRKYALLTGAELICILVTSLIQVHCTKKLLENKVII